MPEWNEEDDTPVSGPGGALSPGLGVRRVVLGGFAGVALLVGPVGLAQAVVPGGSADVEAGNNGEDTMFAALGANTEVVSEVSQARMNEALAAQPATVDEKPPAATTSTSTTTTTTTPPTPPEGTTPNPDNGGPVGDPNSFATWDALAACESGGRWDLNTGNGYYGGLQFSLGTWQSLGGTGYPHEHSRQTQIALGQKLQARSGWGQWPGCASKLGLI